MTGTGTNEEKRAAYDSSTYSNLNKNDSETNNASSGNSVTEGETENSRSGNSITNNEGSSSESSEKVGYIHGNIGVKTSQSMLTEEWQVAMLNVYDSAADLFLTELTIYTY